MKAKHTPGPWRIGRKDGSDANGIRGAGSDGDPENAVCSLYRFPLGDATMKEAEEVITSLKMSKDVLANAYLIAAAPELLEACEKALAAIRSEGGCGTGYEKECPLCVAKRTLRIAIAKAKGESDE